MPEGLFPPTLLVVVFGLMASVGWGLGDFGGGFLSRRAPVLGVLFISQVFSLSVGIPLLVLTPEPAMTLQDYVFSAFGGLVGGSGLAVLYHGLSVGRMSVVMPIAAMLTALIPVVFGFATEGIPPPLAVSGIVAAIIGVVLVSSSPGGEDGRPSGILYGLLAGVLFGMFPIATNAISDDVLVGPVVTVRMASIVTAGVLILLLRRPWRVGRATWPALLGVGLVDMLATASYLAALAVGPLSIAAILTSLSNVVTVILAAVVLRERITPMHGLGIAAAAVSVLLIAAS